MILVVSLPLSFFLGIGASPSALPCRTHEANMQVRHALATLPSDSILLRELRDDRRGDGVRYPWMDEMRKLGIRSVLIETRFEWDDRPVNIRVNRTLFFASYDDKYDQIVDPEKLAKFRMSGLQGELEKEALDETAKRTGFIFEKPMNPVHEGVGYATFLSAECLPNQGTILEPLDPNEKPLEHAIQLGDEIGVDNLLAKGVSRADLNSAVFLSAGEESVTIVKKLISAGADLNTPDAADGETPLTLAIRSQKPANVRALLEAGVDVNLKDALGMPPLVAVVKDSRDPRQSVQLAAALLRRGADPNARDSDGNTALSAAKAHRNISLVQVLTAAGARQ
jgi:hypothetical protein